MPLRMPLRLRPVRRHDVLLLLALAGVGIATYLTYVALNERIEPLCTPFGDCQTVQRSQYARVAGVPVASFGLAMYLGLVALLLARRSERWGGVVFLPAWTFALALGGTLYSLYLTYLELWVIHAICVWCVGSAITVTLICVLSAPDVRPVRAGREG